MQTLENWNIISACKEYLIIHCLWPSLKSLDVVVSCSLVNDVGIWKSINKWSKSGKNSALSTWRCVSHHSRVLVSAHGLVMYWEPSVKQGCVSRIKLHKLSKLTVIRFGTTCVFLRRLSLLPLFCHFSWIAHAAPSRGTPGKFPALVMTFVIWCTCCPFWLWLFFWEFQNLPGFSHCFFAVWYSS